MKKRITIWCVSMLSAAFLVNLVGTLFSRFVCYNVPPMIGYVNKCDAMFHPQPTMDDPEYTQLGALAMRAVLDDMHIGRNVNSLCSEMFVDVSFDQSYIFMENDTMSPLSKDSFEIVYEETEAGTDYMKHAWGVVRMREFCKLDEAKALYDELSEHPDAYVRLDAYTVEDFVYTPAKVTLTDGNGTEYGTFEFPVEGELQQAENLYLYNGRDLNFSDKLWQAPEDNSVWASMQTAYLGERYVDRLANKYAAKPDPGPDAPCPKRIYGIGQYAEVFTNTSDDGTYRGVFVHTCDYRKSLFVWTAVLCIPISLACFLPKSKNRKPESESN